MLGIGLLGDSQPAQGLPFWMSPVPTRHAGTILALGANQSSNWSGYNQGLLEKAALLTAVSGDWIVPTAARHGTSPGNSSAWVGIGGGCLETTCLPGLQDPTLIQAGTNQDVDADGNDSYSAWWEIIPLPQILVPSFNVGPGNHIRVTITQTLPEVWQIKIENFSTGQNGDNAFVMTVPYTSVFGTAEWILETPTVISTDSGVGLASMPELGSVEFFNARVAKNFGTTLQNPGLVPAEALELVDSSGTVIARPSDPSGGDSFSVCTQSSC